MDIAALVNQIGMPVLAVLVPIVIAAVKKVLPSIKEKAPWAIPLLAPIVGAAGDAILALLAGLPVTGWKGAAAGLLGIGVREIVDQTKKAVQA